ncbi:rpsA [Symbiodinium natans]|uniref:RpsA protein n=1 Tax=Symbiodinium natans TaxID=878477 RepID=A0A812I0V0_9DINO|nr:rpsA [Symbiodinium natans]
MASKSSRSARVFAFLVLVACLPSPAFVGSPSRSPTSRQPHERGLQARRAQATAEFEVGDAVRALHADHQEWYEGVIQGINPDGSYSVQMDTPDYAEWVDVPKDLAEPLFVYKVPDMRYR